MPIHDWTRVRAGRFHHFHQRWISALSDALNAGGLPPGYLALSEQITGGPQPDVIALKRPPRPGGLTSAGLSVAERPPQVRFRTEADAANYARRADHVAVRHEDGDLVAVIEIVSPGNKDSAHAVRSFTRKAVQFLAAGVHLLVVDLFPPNRRNPQGIHPAIWDRVHDEAFALPPDKPLTTVSYSAGRSIAAYIEPVAVGDSLPDLPLFLTAEQYVPCPLEATYQTTWAVFPAALKGPLEAA